jgi:hypothetical protein
MGVRVVDRVKGGEGLTIGGGVRVRMFAIATHGVERLKKLFKSLMPTGIHQANSSPIMKTPNRPILHYPH